MYTDKIKQQTHAGRTYTFTHNPILEHMLNNKTDNSIEGFRKRLEDHKKESMPFLTLHKKAGEEIRGVPDGTGPHGRGLGLGEGKADGTGLENTDKKKKVYGIPDGTGPHGRGLGLGEGKGDGTGIQKLIELLKKNQDKDLEKKAADSYVDNVLGAIKNNPAATTAVLGAIMGVAARSKGTSARGRAITGAMGGAGGYALGKMGTKFWEFLNTDIGPLDSEKEVAVPEVASVSVDKPKPENKNMSLIGLMKNMPGTVPEK